MRWPDTLDRYLLREIALPFVVGLGLFCTVVAFAQVLKVSDAVTGLGVGTADVGAALAYSLPPLLGVMVPVASLFACMMGLGRLGGDRELLALAAAGIGPGRLLRVPAALGAGLALVAGLAMGLGEPWGIRGLRVLMAQSAQRALAAGVRAEEFNEWLPGLVLYAGGRDRDGLRDVFFADRRDPARPLTVSARRGRIAAGPQRHDLWFTLADGTMLERDAAGRSRLLRFEGATYRLDVGALVGQRARFLSPLQELGFAAMWRQAGDRSLPAAEHARLTVAAHRRLALPLAAWVFAVLAVPLAGGAGTAARARGLLACGAIVGAYYYVGRALELSARGGRFPPALAAWLPDVAGLALAAWMLWRRRQSAA